MAENMTGEQLFLRYAFPCALDKMIQNRISPEFHGDLERALTVKTPRRGPLKYCFPHAFKAMREWAESIGRRSELWNLENVANYWRHHHGHTGECAVELVTALGDSDLLVPVRLSDGREFPAVNQYKYAFKAGAQLYIHRRCVAEVAPLLI